MADYRKASAFVAGGASAAMLVAVMAWEGNKPDAYPDPGVGWKLPTICVGHTNGVTRGQHATAQECQQYLSDDMKASGREVARCVKAPITQGQFDALVSFDFNTGALCRSRLVLLLNSGNCHGASMEFGRWVNAGGKTLPGLVSRRAGEREVFERDCR